MFSGIVEAVGTVAAFERRGPGAALSVATELPLEEVRTGDSIAVSGVCLTITAKGGGRFETDVSAETLARTSLGGCRAGRTVNLERALRLGGRLDGHLVYGHVDGTGTIREVRPAGESRVFHIRTDPSIMRYVVFKGAVAVDGVSLTVSALQPDGFEVTLIPATLERTTFGAARPGAAVNVETDIVGKYILRFIERPGGGVSLDFLKKHGFA